jgi:hypothetical protein
LAEITCESVSSSVRGRSGIACQGFIAHNAEVARPFTHLLEHIAAAAQQVDQRDAFGID